MRAETNAALLALVDPMASESDRAQAYWWWDREVYVWRLHRGELTDAERMMYHETQPPDVIEKNGCGQIVVNWRGECDCPDCRLKRAELVARSAR